MTQTTHSAHAALSELDRRTEGPVHLIGGPGYDRARTGYQLLSPHRPAAVVEAGGPGDVQAAVRAAAGAGWPVAAQATGHGLGAPLEQGVLVSTARMRGVRVDPDAATAHVAAGATWREVIAAAAPYGLAPLSGSMPGVGAVSYTLGGGVGLLARSHGFAADRVRAMEVVTADGRLRRLGAGADEELFWALRGGGGSFGLVTSMEIGLVEVRRVYAGGIFFDLGRHPGAPAVWRHWTRSAPEQTTSAVTMLVFPDVEGMPGDLRGRHVCQIQICHAGPAEEGRRVVQPLLEAGVPLRTTLGEIAYTDSAAVFDEPERPHGYRSQSLLLDALDEDALDGLRRRTGAQAPLMCVVGLRHLGGALARPPRDAGAVGHRNAAYALSVLSPVGEDAEHRARELHSELLAPFAPWTVGRSLNFSFGPAGVDEVRAAFAPEDYRRLRALKARVDPGGLIRANHPIPPAPRQ